jgi:hypothetical protein
MDPEFARYVALLQEASVARNLHDYRGAADKQLEAVIAAPSVWSGMRWDMFYLYFSMLIGNWTKVLDRDYIILKANFVENEEEPILFRAFAAYLLGLMTADMDEEQTISYFRMALSLCERVTLKEGKIEVLYLNPKEATLLTVSPDSQTQCIREILEDTKQEIRKLLEFLEDSERKAQKEEDDRLYQADPNEFIVQMMMKTNGGSREMANEMIQHMLADGPLDDPLKRLRPPKISSKVIEQISRFPEKDTIFFICEDLKKNEEDAVTYGRHLDPSCIEGSKRYRVFTVDLRRYQAGKETKIFEQINVCACDPRESRPKHIISTFAKACIAPIINSRPGTYQPPSYRPMRVFLETPHDANHPQTRSFMSMMGCSDISAIDPVLKDILDKTKGDVMEASSKNFIVSEPTNPVKHTTISTLTLFCNASLTPKRIQRRCPISATPAKE